jgi:hypothetical protein
MRALLSSSASAPALLQRALPGGGAAMVAVEGAATIPGDKGWQTEKEQSRPAPTFSSLHGFITFAASGFSPFFGILWPRNR